MGKQKVFRLFFVTHFLLTVCFLMQAISVSTTQHVPLSKAINICATIMRQLLEDHNVKRSQTQIARDLTIARRILKVQSDANGMVSLAVINHVLHAYHQWLALIYPPSFPNFLSPTTLIQSITPQRTPPMRPIPSRSSGR